MVLKHWTRPARQDTRVSSSRCRVPSAASSLSSDVSTDDYLFLGHGHNVGDFNGDDRIDLAGLSGYRWR